MDINKKIKDASDLIIRNISSVNDRTLLSLNILNSLPNLISLVAIKVYQYESNEFNENLAVAIDCISKIGKYNFIFKLYNLVQKNMDTFFSNPESSEHLLYIYCDSLIKIKDMLEKEFGLKILSNIFDYLKLFNREYTSYYEEINKKLNEIDQLGIKSVGNKDLYYIKNKTPKFTSNGKFYEFVISPANDFASKFSTTIVYSLVDIPSNYSIRLNFTDETINVDGNKINLKIINEYLVSIRVSEFKHFSNLLNKGVYNNTSEFTRLMDFLTKNNSTLLEIVLLPYDEFKNLKNSLINLNNSSKIFDMLESCRTIIENDLKGSNVIRYILTNMNNKIIKSQFSTYTNRVVQHLNLSNKSLPFDDMPYASALSGHFPKAYDLFDVVPHEGREHEILSRALQIESLKDNKIYHKCTVENVDDLIDEFNSKLIPQHKHREVCKFDDYLYIRGNYESTKDIIFKINELSNKCEEGYEEVAQDFLERETLDCEYKKNIISNLFAKSNVGLIYGPAGTGKTTLIGHIKKMLNSMQFLFLTNTNPALHNLIAKVDNANSVFSTISKFLYSKCDLDEFDCIVIDECSVVSNNMILNLLNSVTTQKVILVGDHVQIESIAFGNWFSISEKMFSDSIAYKLEKTFRSSDNSLLDLWKMVRNKEEDLVAYMSRNNYISNFDNSIFTYEKDNIILCFNYEGLYGINNINRILQVNNKNKEYVYDLSTYKVNDPVLFSENNIYHPRLHNNLKGIIEKIREVEEGLKFTIRVDKTFNDEDRLLANFEIVEEYDCSSVISFIVKRGSRDNDEDDGKKTVPFQIAYATSVHKSQGLEFKSVKFIIPSNVKSRITHNVFYTAITRATSNLKVYCDANNLHEIISGFNKEESDNDLDIFINHLEEVDNER